jgi:HAD superfamily hydrolase (TIGR01484 family)
MRPLSELPKGKIRFVFTDIDDTLTRDGLLLPEAYQALWLLSKNAINVVPITGRPAGWCELIARQWPVAGIIGENGGFYFRYHKRKMLRHYFFDSFTRLDNQKRLERVRADILANVNRAQVASDQFCRSMDLAIDYAEDVTPPLPQFDVDKIVKIFNSHGAIAKISSIHVNGWFGDYDKLSMCKEFLKREHSLDFSNVQNELVFCGDSPNDEPMFEAFTLSVGVANVKEFINRLKHLPKFITGDAYGLGFAQLANHLLKN